MISFDTFFTIFICRGDSGGPLMYFDDKIRSYVMIAIVEGAIGECGDIDFPGIYVRLDHPVIWNFIQENRVQCGKF
jgi:hypothetical protein